MSLLPQLGQFTVDEVSEELLLDSSLVSRHEKLQKQNNPSVTISVNFFIMKIYIYLKNKCKKKNPIVMSRVIYLILFYSFLFLSCSTKEEKISRDVEKVYKKITKNIWGPEKVVGSGHQSGNVSGSARISVQSEYISVTYSALGYSHRADGKLTEFDLVKKCGYKNCKDYIGYSLQASWNPENDSSGRLNITVSKKNIVEIYIFGDGNWKHWKEIDMKEDMTVQNLLRETYKSIYQEEEDFNFENNDFKKEALIVETDYMKWFKDNNNSFF